MQKAFTLIELLVVIAIIGILASAAMLRYPMTVRRVKDSRIITSLTQFRVEAHSAKGINGDYDAVDKCVVGPGTCACATNNSLDVLCKDIQEMGTQDVIINVNNDLSGYCAVAYLPDYNQYFCVDHNLIAKRYDVSPAAPAGACKNSCPNVAGAGNCACE